MRQGSRPAIVALCWVGLSCAAGAQDAELSHFTAADRVLIVSPHPDDETLCCAGLAQQAMRAGATVAVVWVTSGDGFEVDALIVERSLRPHRGLVSLARL